MTMAELLETFAHEGRVVWIGLRPARCDAMRAVAAVAAETGRGLVGDHRYEHGGAKRQVSLIQAEHLEVIAALCECGQVAPERLRRNLVVSGVNLLALKDKRFFVGTVLLEGTGQCHPCSRMEEALGRGGYNAVRGHGGITARVLSGGEIRVADAVRPTPAHEG